ncbi:hypothetical protein GOV09_01615 [Candidatus Woesearchaeota archaeon]|nr:hypothetical protein [Candidatus Woesearchaeota archaeon]
MNKELVEKIRKQLREGKSQSEIKSNFVHRGNDILQVESAISDALFRNRIMEAEAHPKHVSKKLLMVALILLLGVTLFLQTDTIREEDPLEFLNETFTDRDTPLTEEEIGELKEKGIDVSLLARLGGDSSDSIDPRAEVRWCTTNAVWTDPIVDSDDPLIVRGFVAYGTTNICHASPDKAPRLGYYFTKNNNFIWELRMIDGGLDKFQIKPLLS